MNEEKIKKLIQTEIGKQQNADTFGVNKTPYHLHNNIDSPQIQLTMLGGFPNTFAGQAGNTVVVNSTNTALSFTPFLSTYNQSVYASGTAYSLTATAAKLDFGTIDPTITITVAGTYLLFANVRLDYNGATFAANRTVTLKLRKTSGTPADVTSATRSFLVPIITTLTYTAGVIPLPPVTFVAAASDVIQVWGSIDVVPTAGSLDAVQAELFALRVA